MTTKYGAGKRKEKKREDGGIQGKRKIDKE
jgi:hypothetical protein